MSDLEVAGALLLLLALSGGLIRLCGRLQP